MGLDFLPHDTKINFLKYRTVFLILSALVMIWAIVGPMTTGINYGIDFKGGFVLTVRTQEKANVQEMREKLTELELGDFSIQDFGSDRDVLIKIGRQPGDDQAQNVVLDKIKGKLGNVEYRAVDTVGPKASEELLENGIKAVFWSVIAMLVYVAFQFEWRFGLCAIYGILHDCLAIVLLYVIFPFEFKTNTIVGILITAGYSINDTIVVFDRIRENITKYKKMSMVDLVNLSINETLSRTILTSGTTLLALLALYFFGGPVIAEYSAPIIFGIIVGTYSSICLAGPLLTFFDIRKTPSKDNNSEDTEKTA